MCYHHSAGNVIILFAVTVDESSPIMSTDITDDCHLFVWDGVQVLFVLCVCVCVCVCVCARLYAGVCMCAVYLILAQ